MCEVPGEILALTTKSIKYRQSTHSCVTIFNTEKCQFRYLVSVPTHSRKFCAKASLLEVQAPMCLALALWKQIIGLAKDKLLLDLSIFVNISSLPQHSSCLFQAPPFTLHTSFGLWQWVMISTCLKVPANFIFSYADLFQDSGSRYTQPCSNALISEQSLLVEL